MKINPGYFAAALVGLICLGSVISMTIGSADISVSQVFTIIQKSLTSTQLEPYTPNQRIILYFRLPRVILSLLIGAALAVAGAVLQGVFRNPMAEPYVLGISSGAAFGVTLVLIAGMQGALALQGGAFVGAFLTAALVLILAKGVVRNNAVTLLLVGMTLSFLLSALISLLMYLNRDLVESIMFWTFGSFSSASWGKVRLVLIPLIISFSGLFFFAREINLLSQGEDVAHTLGVNQSRLLVFIVLLTSLLTATAVSVSGIIGFIGLITPHVVRRLTGPDARRLIVLSALLGGLFTMLSDTVARSLLAPQELPVGILTALIGAPGFIALLVINQSRGYS